MAITLSANPGVWHRPCLRATRLDTHTVRTMARSTDAAAVVLDSLQVLYELGGRPDVDDERVLAALMAVGVNGFSQDHSGYLATISASS